MKRINFAFSSVLILALFSLQLNTNVSMNNVMYYDFDQVEYYSIAIEEEELRQLEDLEFNGENEIEYRNSRMIQRILTDDFPMKFEDQEWIAKLPELKFKKAEIENNKFADLNRIFSFGEEGKDGIINFCTPIYRDILIFKKNSKITGIAKICFTCGQNFQLDATSNMMKFDLDLDYGGLKNLLYPKNQNE